MADTALSRLLQIARDVALNASLAHSAQVQAKIRRALAVSGDLQVAVSIRTGKVAVALVHASGTREMISSEIARPQLEAEAEEDSKPGYAATRWDALG